MRNKKLSTVCFSLVVCIVLSMVGNPVVFASVQPYEHYSCVLSNQLHVRLSPIHRRMKPIGRIISAVAPIST